MAEPPAWKRRFTAPRISFPSWAETAPERLAFLSTESGSGQVWALDRDTGDRRQVTEERIGVETMLVAPDGRIVWWRDETGGERGRWMAVAFEGGSAEPLVPDAPDGWAAGISFADGAAVLGLVTDDDYQALLVAPDASWKVLQAGDRPLGVGRLDPQGSGGISADGSMVCIRHTDHGDILNHALRVYGTDDGRVVGELADDGSNLDPVAWSPGDDRLLFTSELGTFERPALWSPGTGERRELTVDLPGAAIPMGWWPDGSAILVRHEHEGTFELHRVEVADANATVVADPGGEITEAAVRPDGAVWFLASDSANAPRVLDAEGHEVLGPPGERAPAGRSPTSFWFDNPHGQRIQAFVVTPPGAGPFPTVLSVHGGPEWHERDAFDPETQALADAGFAVALVNYRGSTGYGIAFRRTLIGNPWLPETEDLLAGLDALIAAGVADPDRVAFSGWSWGGCLACLNEGLHPDRWRAVFAGIPAGDFVAAHHASMPEIQAYDVAQFGGTPEELPEMYAERNPMTYVDRATAPVLVIAGEHDPRCPIEGITPWVDALRQRGVSVEVHLYPAGHHASDVEEQVGQMELILDFFRRYV
jgi:dipeptidyl aminopeptidase/acylaminoacyl peptidase